MSFLDPIESGINSLLDPLTSGLGSTPTEVDQPAQPAPTTANSPNNPDTEQAPTPTSAPAPAPTTAEQPTNTPPTTAQAAPVTPTSQAATTATASSSTQQHTSSASATTLRTSTRSSISFTTSTSTSAETSLSSTTPVAPSATKSLPASESSSASNSGSNGGGVSMAGVVVAIVFAIALVVSIIWLTCRFCPPVRRRIDAWRAKGHQERSYREAIDGPAPPEKDEGYSPSSNSHSRDNSGSTTRSIATAVPATASIASSATAKEISVAPPKRFSFFALGRNPQLSSRHTRFSWEPQAAAPQGVIEHQTYASPNSASPSERPRGDGLGLGRMSLLRNHSLLRKAGLDVPPELPGPSITSTQAAIATSRPSMEYTPQRPSQEVKRKPVPGRPPIAVMPPRQQQQQQPAPQQGRGLMAPKADTRMYSWEGQRSESSQGLVPRMAERNTPTPTLHVDIPLTPVERRSQIGMAMSEPARSNTPGIGVAR